jgi:hypothetical protein
LYECDPVLTKQRLLGSKEGDQIVSSRLSEESIGIGIEHFNPEEEHRKKLYL